MSHTQLIDSYATGADELARAIYGLTPDQLRSRPIPGKWSTLEVVCHLADTEQLFAERMKRVIAEDRPPLLYAEPDLWVANLAYDARDAAEEVALIKTTRQQMARILRTQQAAAWQRIGIHNEAGEQTLEQLLRKAVDHLAHHLTFIQAKREALKA
jgi:uncharacterized damage-inducible protein DinB